jgi:hypothetical protein
MDHGLSAPVCGLTCGDCRFPDDNCGGCGKVKGRPFWTGSLPSGICPIHDCRANGKSLEHCGFCESRPCGIFLKLRNPGLNDEEFQKSIGERTREPRKRLDTGTRKWLAAKRAGEHGSVRNPENR